MKKLGISLLAVLALSIGIAGTALANDKNLKKTVTFDQDVMVNDNVVKKGTYQIKFVSADSSISIMDDDELVASAKVSVKEGAKKAPYNSLAFTTTEKGKLLTAITFGGDKRVLHLTEFQNSTAGE